MPRSVRIGSILIAMFGAGLWLEALWAGAGPRWFAASRSWAALHPPMALRGLIASGLGFFVLAWGLRKGYRWAWFTAMTWTIAWAGLVIALLGIFLLGRTSEGELLIVSFMRAYPLESLAGGGSAAALLGSLAYLCRKDARAYFRSGP